MRRAGVVTLASIVILAVTGPLWASFAATEVYLPSVGRGPGKQDTQWYTTVWVYNPGASPVDAEFELLLRDQSNTEPPVFNDTIPPGSVRQYDNAVFTLFGVEGFGALRVTAGQRVLVNGRIFAQPEAGEVASVGQFFAGVPASFAIAAGETTQLLGVAQTTPESESVSRYNYGFVESAGSSVTLRIRAFDADNVEVGTGTLLLRPYEVRQWNISVLAPEPDLENARIEVEALAGAGRVITFGSRLANQSSDPSTFEMLIPASRLENGGSGTISGVMAGVGLTGGGTSGEVTLDVGVGDGLEVSADAVAVADGGIDAPKLSTVNAPAEGDSLVFTNSGLQWQDVSGGGGNGDITAVIAGNGLTGGGSVGDVQIAVAPGGVTQGMLAAGGATAGLFLGTDGVNLAWQSPPGGGGGLTLPYAGTTSSSGDGFAVTSTASNGTALSGIADSGASARGVFGHSSSGFGLVGESGAKAGLRGFSSGGAIASAGVEGESTDSQGTGVYGVADGPNAVGVWGSSTNGNAGWFSGNVKMEDNLTVQGNLTVSGTISKGGGTFRIDHPLDPRDRYLIHSFVESSERLNVYTGNVVLDRDGAAAVDLPRWFEPLNRDFRYQLTAIGAPGPGLYIAEEISGGVFRIAGGEPGMKVSWQVTGVRHDPWAEANRLEVEPLKGESERGKYLHPAAYGVAEDQALSRRRPRRGSRITSDD